VKPPDCGVIFDMDGVLADTAEAHYQSWQVVAEECDTEISRELFHETFGRPNHQIIPRMLGRDVTDEELHRVDRLKEEAFRDIVAETVKPVPGVVDMIEDLHAEGYRIGLGSSGPRENIEAILGALRVRGYFGAIVSGWDVERGKPEPDVFLMVAEGLGIPAGNCVVVEDVPAGIRAAHAAGMLCVAVTTTHDGELLREADRVLEDLKGFRPADVAEMLEARHAEADSGPSAAGTVP